MKKVTVLFLILILCLSLYACGSNDNTEESLPVPEPPTENPLLHVDELLQGTWEYYADTKFGTRTGEILEFDNGSLHYKGFVVGYEDRGSDVWGTYEITESHIITTLSGTTNYFDYEVIDDQLTFSIYVDSGADKGNTRVYEQTSKSASKSTKKPNSSPSKNNSPSSGERNALRAAKNYLEVMPFSYNGLVEQLEFEGYSHSESVYGADNCGANWYEQAVKAAENYLDVMAFSRSGLIEQLEYEGYTHDQAVYGVDKAY